MKEVTTDDLIYLIGLKEVNLQVKESSIKELLKIIEEYKKKEEKKDGSQDS